MSKFNHYAVSLDKAVKAYREKYHTAEKAMQKAKADYERVKDESVHHDFRETPVEKIRRESNVLKYKARADEAKAEFAEVWEGRHSLMTMAEKLRSQLADDVTAAYYADPAAIDQSVMVLLDSGILTAKEYRKLYDDAVSAGNHTMCRVIKGYAEKEVEKSLKQHGQFHPDVSILNGVVHDAKANDGRAVMGDYDMLKTCVQYITGNPEIGTPGNPAILDEWDGLTAQAVDEF